MIGLELAWKLEAGRRIGWVLGAVCAVGTAAAVGTVAAAAAVEVAA